MADYKETADQHKQCEKVSGWFPTSRAVRGVIVETKMR